VHQAKAVASEAYYQSCNFSHMVFAGPGTDYKHPLMAHSVLAHSLYQYLGTPLYHKRAMVDALYPRKLKTQVITEAIYISRKIAGHNLGAMNELLRPLTRAKWGMASPRIFGSPSAKTF
jgi:hypothetical protein